MELYIRVDENNVPVGNPILGDNIRDALPEVDLNNLPSGWAIFNRVPKPRLGVYETFEEPPYTYELIDGEFYDVWHHRSMTSEEKEAEMDRVKFLWTQQPYFSNFSAWVFNEVTCKFEPPIPYPEDVADNIGWRGSSNSWEVFPPYPEDSTEELAFDPIQWKWVSL